MVQQESKPFGLPDIVNVLVVGDPGVGKTSLISSMVHGAFNPDVPARVEDVTLKAELCPDNVPIRIVDSPELELQDLEGWRKIVGNIDVFCVVYNSCSDVSLDRIRSHWIPTLRKCEPGVYSGNYKPKILVANKIDQSKEEKCLDLVTSILRNFDDVVAFTEVSAKEQNVEFIYTAQQSVIYPIAPLFDLHLRTLTRKCRQALLEIFKLCDKDNDGLLNDYELNQIQENCYGGPLQKENLDDLKSIIKQSITDGLISNSLTPEGFLFVQTLSIDKGNPWVTWKLLRKFKYDNRLELRNDLRILKLEETANQSEQNPPSLSSDVSKNPTFPTLSLSNNKIQEEEEELEEPKEHFSGQVEVWLQDNKRIIKQSVGFTMATLFSMFALKFIVGNVIKTRF